MGGWVQNRRRDKRNGKLSKDKIKQLDGLGFIWEPYENQWNEGYKLFKEYKAEHNSVLVPSRYKLPDGFPLGKWVVRQRIEKNKSNHPKKSPFFFLLIIIGEKLLVFLKCFF